jgi:hypothetical protein
VVLVLDGIGIGRYWYWSVLVLVGIGIGIDVIGIDPPSQKSNFIKNHYFLKRAYS